VFGLVFGYTVRLCNTECIPVSVEPRVRTIVHSTHIFRISITLPVYAQRIQCDSIQNLIERTVHTFVLSTNIFGIPTRSCPPTTVLSRFTQYLRYIT